MKGDRLLLFDLGDVIFDLSLKEAFLVWSEAADIPVSELSRRCHFNSGSYPVYEMGGMNTEEFRKKFYKEIDCNMSTEEFVRGWNAMLKGAMPGVEEVLPKLAEKYTLAVLSNTNPIHEAYFNIRWKDLLYSFDQIFLSHNIHARKPEIKAFQTVLDYYSIKPEQVIYFDDTSENIDTAHQLGMEAHLIDTPDGVKSAAERLGLI